MAGVTETMTVAPMESLHVRLRPQPPPSRLMIIEASSQGSYKPKSRSNARLDPVRILEPARKKLSTLEAQRVMGALQEAIRRAEVTVSLPYILQHLSRFRNFLGSELIRALEEHQTLLESLSELQPLEEMFCETESQLSSRSESRQSQGSEGENWRQGEADGQAEREKFSGKGGEEIHESHERELKSVTDRQSELDARSATSRRTGLDAASGWQSGSYRESEMDRRSEIQPSEVDGLSIFGRQTAGSKSSHGFTNRNEEEDENEEHVTNERGETTDQPLSRTSMSPSQRSVDFPERLSSQMERALRNLSLQADRLRDSSRNILRLFALNPKAATTVSKKSEEYWKDSSRNMIQYLKDLRDFLMAMLLTTPAEELERAKYLREVLEKERYNAEAIAKLSAELNTAEEEKNEAVRQQNEIIRKLQSNLHQTEKTSEENIRRMKLEAEKQEAADKKNTEGRSTKLQQDLTQVQAQYNNLKEEHKEKELALRRRKFQVETEVENWIQKFDLDMGERQDEYERIDLVYTEEKRQLNELEEKFKRLETEYQQIQEERRIAREARDMAERELQMCIRAATTIQAFWRSFKVRKAIKLKKKKGKGKAGAKKK